MYERLPKELIQNGKFCLWRYEVQKGKWTKVPYRTDGRCADSTNAADFSSFDAVTAVLAHGGYDGIGILIDGEFCAFDVDDCIENGILSDTAMDIVETMNTYTEISPSGKGIRGIFKAPGFVYDIKEFYINNRSGKIEIYHPDATAKYVTTTGNSIRDVPVRDCSDVLPMILDKYMRRPKKPTGERTLNPPGAVLPDEAIIEKASSAKNGELFRRLWDGDSTGYLSDSERDLALASLLAFWCGGDTEQMWRLIQQSGAYREKWERDDYREHTLKKAVEGCSDFYKPPDTGSADADFAESPFTETPIPLDGMEVPTFPVDALPKDIADYVLAVSESTQTPVDLPAVCAISILSIGLQGKYVIQPKADWKEPLNTFTAVFMPPSERKSAVCGAMSRPLNEYEREWNTLHAAEIDFCKTQKSILERRLKTLEDQASKGKTEVDEVRRASEELTMFKEVKPLRFYCDDVTTEKLVSVLAENNGRAAIFSPEGGIFDLLKGMYTRYVNIDVYLKGYSGDPIRVDRVGRNSETIYAPVLTVMLMAQPSVLAGIMENGNFRGRGLTARFLYCVPESNVGKRRYRSEPISEDVYRRYEQCIRNVLTDEPESQPEVITLSAEADEMLEAFSEELEPKLKTEYADIADWAGKLVGNVARIAGLLCRANVSVCREFLSEPEPLIVSGEVMENAIRIGRYYIEHAMAAFSVLGADESIRNCRYVLNAIEKAGLAECTRRDVMRLCRALKTRETIQPVLDQLVEYGYLAEKNAGHLSGKGRSPAAEYIVNPCIYETQ